MSQLSLQVDPTTQSNDILKHVLLQISKVLFKISLFILQFGGRSEVSSCYTRGRGTVSIVTSQVTKKIQDGTMKIKIHM